MVVLCLCNGARLQAKQPIASIRGMTRKKAGYFGIDNMGARRSLEQPIDGTFPRGSLSRATTPHCTALVDWVGVFYNGTFSCLHIQKKSQCRCYGSKTLVGFYMNHTPLPLIASIRERKDISTQGSSLRMTSGSCILSQ